MDCVENRTRIRNMDALLDEAERLGSRARIAVACAHDREVLKAVGRAQAHGIGRFDLVGEEAAIRTLARELGVCVAGCEIHDAPGEEQGAAKAVELVASGRAHVLLKGFLDSGVFLRAVLNRECGLREQAMISHTVLMEMPAAGRMYYLTDAAMAIKPSLEEKALMVTNALQVTHALGLENPVVAVLAESEKVNPKMEATVHAQELVAMNRDGRLPGCRVGGPYALDNAVSVHAAQHKNMDDPLAGNADILLAPDLAAGNILYKGLMYFAGARAAGVVVGTRAPVVLNSRADTDETKLNAMALGVVMAHARGMI
ncbi:bifunctional enoyl-CoA hydratase/phosphate acetyltransferase [Pseudodesulfovibrio senegalensis]|uniref:Bifunctional enoyl-CoA hydratase/phosphate acetyltransferase n=1 Tax=Pseudodesulfovibrio senegalensis TaxID=1721087 RepID=A0A6N6N0Y2_9BACT|nr:bifunctional enoyl-CoA hydratase/phosphate acetyltransferase [Pseudodesulfovibrio senegalensis]KAB1440903.1 bifunctional enoyl-CoA hydratase/phosphate acetyltransferase [Pseudodesulfovibrio senegalensis]